MSSERMECPNPSPHCKLVAFNTCCLLSSRPNGDVQTVSPRVGLIPFIGKGVSLIYLARLLNCGEDMTKFQLHGHVRQYWEATESITEVESLYSVPGAKTKLGSHHQVVSLATEVKVKFSCILTHAGLKVSFKS